jgi:hypothetical protein
MQQPPALAAFLKAHQGPPDRGKHGRSN